MDKPWIVTTAICVICEAEQPLCRECDDFRRLCRADIAICSECKNDGSGGFDFCTCKVHFLVEDMFHKHLSEGRYPRYRP